MKQIANMDGSTEVYDVEEGENGIISTVKRAPKILLSEPNRIEFWDITPEEWSNLIKACKTKDRLKIKDITILRLYSTFMQFPFLANCADNNDLFLTEFSNLLGKKDPRELCKFLDPETTFNVSENNRVQIKELLVNLQQSKIINSDENDSDQSGDGENGQTRTEEEAARKSQVKTVIEILTNLLFEAL